MHNYELVAIINPEVDEEGVSKIIDRLTQSINGRGGVVEEVSNWGKRKLAYPVRKFMEAGYVLTRFKVAPKSVKGIEKEIGSLGGVLRYLVVKAGD